MNHIILLIFRVNANTNIKINNLMINQLFIKKLTLIFLLISSTYVLSSQESVSPSTFQSHVEYLASEELEGRGLGTKGKALAKNYIKEQFESAGIETYKGSYFQDFEVRLMLAWVQATNVIGVIEGSDPILKEEYIVLGAHYDHLGYQLESGERVYFLGADDNASGVAAIIELAKYFSEESNRPKRSLIFIAFDAEESGLLGASHFVSSLNEDEQSKIKAMFSFDMVGMYNANGNLDLKGIGTIENGDNIAREFSAEHDISLSNLSANIERRTDTYPFGKVGIPSVHVFTGLKSPYHKPEDKFDLLDYEGMVKIHNYMSDVITGLGNHESLMPSKNFQNSAEFSAIGSGSKSKIISLGVIMNNGGSFHNYEDEFYRGKSIYKISGGLMANVGLNSTMSLQTEILYDMNGSKSFEGVFRRHSLTIPLNVQIGTPRDVNIPVRAFGFAGGYYRYNFAGFNDGMELDYTNIYDRNELGINWGIGVDLFKFQFAFTHRSALTDITQQETNIFARENTFTIGYRF